MMSFVGGDFSSTSDSDSIESSSSSSSSSSDSRKPKIQGKILKPFKASDGQSYEEKPDAVKEASPGHSKEKQAANTEDRKAGKERKEDVQEKNAQKKERKKPAPQKSIKIIKRIIAKNKNHTTKVNQKLNLALKAFSAEQRLNKAVLKKNKAKGVKQK